MAKAQARKPISKGLRYGIFERDSFTCQYCGAKAPDVKLTVDHIIPVSANGDNDHSNLVTCCKDCNAGKGSKISLRTVTNNDLAGRLAEYGQRRELLEDLTRVEKAARRAAAKRLAPLLKLWEACCHTKPSLSLANLIEGFLSALGAAKVEEAIGVAGRWGRNLTGSDWSIVCKTAGYFAGVCKRMIAELEAKA